MMCKIAKGALPSRQLVPTPDCSGKLAPRSSRPHHDDKAVGALSDKSDQAAVQKTKAATQAYRKSTAKISR
jgi:hypothetical protein